MHLSPTSFDLPAYLARIGLAGAPVTDATGLALVQRAHRLAIPFENLNIPLGDGISLNPDTVFDKLVTRRRGGYCFEQNGLFSRALERLGFEVRPLLARVWLGVDALAPVPPRTHALSLVTIAGEAWIADAGFGGSYAPPMRLAAHEVAEPDGTRHRLSRDADHGWMLERLGSNVNIDGRGSAEGWARQYSFTLDPVWPADLDQANHFVSTVPGGLFTDNVVVSIVLPNGFASVFNRAYSRTNAKGIEKSELASARSFQMRLSLIFGIDLSADKVERIGLYPAS